MSITHFTTARPGDFQHVGQIFHVGVPTAPVNIDEQPDKIILQEAELTAGPIFFSPEAVEEIKKLGEEQATFKLPPLQNGIKELDEAKPSVVCEVEKEETKDE